MIVLSFGCTVTPMASISLQVRKNSAFQKSAGLQPSNIRLQVTSPVRESASKSLPDNWAYREFQLPFCSAEAKVAPS